MFLTAVVSEDVLRRVLSMAWERGGVLETVGKKGKKQWVTFTKIPSVLSGPGGRNIWICFELQLCVTQT